jgi:hypothetical protein
MFFAYGRHKKETRTRFGCADGSNENGFSQLIIDVIASVFDGHSAAALPAGYHSNGFSAIATQREKEGVQLLIIGFNATDNIFLAFNSGSQIHEDHLVSYVVDTLRLASANCL